MKEKSVVILSGGPDSVTTMYWLLEQGYEVHAITFNYGQKAQIEIEYALKNAKILNIPHKIINISSLNEIYQGVTSLVDSELKITSEFSDQIIVPFRNGIFMAIAVAFAEGIGARKIFYGAHASDQIFYPDCRQEFITSFEKSASLGTGKDFEIRSPYISIRKENILKKAGELGVQLDLTWSCYHNGPIHCGRCESCINRKEAFKQAEIADLTIYEK
jgi:7-cyano-7-deazaguanine synthase